MDDEAGKLRKELDRMAKRLAGEKGEPLSKEEIIKKLDTAKAWVTIIEESQKTREKSARSLPPTLNCIRETMQPQPKSPSTSLRKRSMAAFLARCANASRMLKALCTRDREERRNDNRTMGRLHNDMP